MNVFRMQINFIPWQDMSEVGIGFDPQFNRNQNIKFYFSRRKLNESERLKMLQFRKSKEVIILTLVKEFYPIIKEYYQKPIIHEGIMDKLGKIRYF